MIERERETDRQMIERQTDDRERDRQMIERERTTDDRERDRQVEIDRERKKGGGLVHAS